MSRRGAWATVAAATLAVVGIGALLGPNGAITAEPSPTASSSPSASAFATASSQAPPSVNPTPSTAPPTPSTTALPPSPTASTGPSAVQLPRGGTTVFPAYRLVGYCGYPGATGLGRLGIGRLDDRIAEIETLSQQYAAGRTGQPVMELLATVVSGGPGPDGMWRRRIDPAIVASHLAAARAHHAILLLDIQPGAADFLPEVQAWEQFLREPDVGVALDPEWAIERGQVPGRVFGSTTGAELDSVAAYLAGLVAAGGLPEKVMVYHQLAPSIVKDPGGLHPHPGVALVVSVDGIGTPAAKAGTWRQVVALTPAYVRKGFKLFFQEDAAKGPLMTPAQVLALTPTPDYVMYE